MARTAGQAAPLRRLLAALPLLVLAFWWLSTTSVASLLELDAESRERVWQRPPNSPWHWRFAAPDAVVWPGSSGLGPGRTDDALEGTVRDGVADLSLALHGERIDLELVTGALLQLRSSAPLRVSLIGQSGSDSVLLGSVELAAGARGAHLPLQSDVRRPLDALRLRIETTAGARLGLQELLLLAPDGTRALPCPAQTVADLREQCPMRVPRVDARFPRTPEALLAWRDEVRSLRPAAVVRAPPGWPRAEITMRAARGLHQGTLAWLLAALPLLAAAWSRWRPSASRMRACLELALVFGPSLVLLWSGAPSRDTAPLTATVLASALVGAALLRAPDPDWRWLGDRIAWRSAAVLLLAAGALVGLAAVANAADGDGFAWRPFGSDHAWRYPLWALFQQWLLLRTIAPRMLRVSGHPGWTVLGAGALFGLLHMPNLALMLLTAALGSACTWLGLRHRALLPLATVHAALGLSLFVVVPPWLVRSAEVGARFLMEP